MIPGQEIKPPKYLVIITGPTAIGKTFAAIQIAKHFSTEIISADSRQFYKEMTIGTAMPTAEELAAVTHHLIGNLSIHEYYNVYRYEIDAIQIINQLFRTKEMVLMVGGSGLYIDTICNGIDEMPDAEPEIREQLNQTFAQQGINPLREQLKLLDRTSYDRIDIANPKRIIRALEVCISTGLPYSSLLTNKTPERPFRIIKIGLKRERDELYRLINQRVDKMIGEGLEAEARELYKHKGLTALNTVGYREMFSYFDGNYTLEETIEKIKVNSRRYAKKQMTWFARDTEIKWFHPSELPVILNYIQEQL